MAMGILRWAIAVVTLLLVAAIIVIASWFVREHDKRANYYKSKLEICWRNK
jgi:heme/copper-type cytochrome/quinol oxidase subunit 2